MRSRQLWITATSASAALLAVLAPPARAQIVNVQPLLAREAQPGLSAALEGAVDWRTGNTNLVLVSGSGSARYRSGRHLVFAMARGEEGFNAGNRIVFKHLEHLRYRVDVLGALQLEAFVQFEQDYARRLWPRALAGAGPRYTIVRGERVDLAVAVAFMEEYQRLRAVGQPDDHAIEWARRLSTYAVVALRLTEILRLGETVYVQPRLDDARDVRMLSETELLVTVKERFALKTAFTVAHDSRPPIGIKSLDTGLKSALQISF
jgi:hypothetical protein